MVSLHFSARRALAFLLLCIAVPVGALLITGCTFPWQHTSTSASTNLGAKPTAQQVISAMQKSYRTVTAFHVVMKVKNLGTAESGSIQIRSADGDVLMPDRVKAQANVLFSGQLVAINLVSIGKTQYITDPITGQWRVITGVLNASTLTNPDTGIIGLASKLTNLTGPTDDSVNGTPCWRVSGMLDAHYLSFLTGGNPPAGTLLSTSVCAGKADALPYQVMVVGQAAKSDTAQTTRTFTISNFNESVTITAPQLQ